MLHFELEFTARIDAAVALRHIIGRGIERRKIFHDDTVSHFLPAGQHEGQMNLVAVSYRLFQLIGVSASMIYVDFDDVPQFALLVEEHILHARVLLHQVLQALSHTIAFGLDHIFPISGYAMGLVNVHLNAHGSVLS
jgi:hypothetical protein